MKSVESLQELIVEALADLDLDRQPEGLYVPVRYALTQGGKRLRPLLVLMACDLFEGDVLEALPAATAVEVFHNFTLVHDDLMDLSPIRRGRETVYRKWSGNTAILAGDTMLALAYECLRQLKPEILPEVLRVFNRVAVQVCEGQQYDMDFELRETVSIPEYLEMIRLKTAVLLGGSLEMGALAAGAPANEAQQLYLCGEQLGLAFQMQDDLLDVYSDEAKFGKKKGNDILTGKKTLLFMKALESAEAGDKARLLEHFNSPTEDPDVKVKAVVALYDKLNIRSLTAALMRETHQKALAHLARVEAAPARKEPLKSLASSLLVREY